MAKKSKPSPAKAKEMLHNPPHGKPLSDKQRKYFGYLSNLNLGGKIGNENNNSTHLPTGFVGAGYNNIGRNYSPAWGGQFQMGGSLPGAVGFTYARTGSTPSNGKYAKKTKASAQNGGFLASGVSGAKSTGQFNSNRLQGWNVPVDEAKYLFNALPQRKDDTMVHIWSQDSPSTLLQRKLHPGKPVDTNTIYGDTTALNRPQGANINNFQNGGMLYYQHGLDFKTKGMQDGGTLFDVKALKKRNQKRDSVREALYEKYPKPIDYQKVNNKMLEYFQQEKAIKDDKGYWNPKNKGKAVQIDSNKITMNGVDQPLLGISDTNHIQMMQPGGEYSFHGSNVTEYPLNGGNQNKGQLKKLRQLTDFSNNNNMEQAKDGKWIQGAVNPKHKGYCTPMTKSTCTPKRKALAKTFKKHHGFHEDGGTIGQNGLNLSQYNTTAPNFGPPQGMGYQSLNLGQQQQVSQYGNYQAPSPNLSGQGESTMGAGGGGNMMGGIGQGLNVVGGVIKGIKMLKQEKVQKQQAEQQARLTGVVAQASETRPEAVKRKYVRPEDMAVQPNQMFPSQGTGTNYLSGKNGVSIVGEIQNTYAPNTLYTDLEYEPLNESGKVKQFQMGGLVQGQTDQWGQSLGSSIGGGNATGTPNGGSQVGSSIGSGIGSIFGPVGSIVGGFAGGVIGGALDRNARKITQFQKQTNENTNRIGIQQGVKNIQTQNSSFMENGGWLSHNWNPQVITKFGDYTAKEVYNIAHEGMHSLRTGGNIRQNTNMALGGELKIHGGGHAESISANPYLPDGGETVMFRGKSHANGGMPISFGNSPVEVEGGEPAVKLQDGGSGEDNLVVFGNMKIPSYGVNEIGDEKAKGMKFKNYIAKLSEKETKQNKTITKGLKLINDTDDRDAFDQLKIASGKALLEGGNMKLKQIAEQKQAAANVQNAILETAQEHGLESDALSKGKIKKAKMGAKMTYAQNGSKSAASNLFENISQWFSPDEVDSLTNKGYQPVANKKNILFKDTPGTTAPKGSEDFNKAFGNARKQGLKNFIWKGKQYGTQLANSLSQRDYVGIRDPYNYNIPSPADVSAYTPQVKGGPSITAISPSSSKDVKSNSKGVDYLGAVGQLWPYFRPTNQMGLDPNQLSGEYYALANNILDPVNAQRYSPLLDQPYDISLQDQLNANQADFNAIQRQTAYNPAAQSILAGQKYAANSHVLGEQTRINQANKAGIYSKNRDILNDAQLKNLALLDQQYVRQSQAKSNTKAIAQSALSSIASKIAQNKLENRTLGVYENLYGYRYDNQGRAYNLNAPAQFNIPQNSNELSVDQLQSLIDQKKKNKAKNGYLVKALK